MIVDSSALVAILLREPGHERVLDCLKREPAPAVGSPTLVETGIVLTARIGVGGQTLLARFAQESALVVLPFTDEHWGVAVQAFRRFGKGRHPAQLNFGDCLTYATARLASEPPLCLGNDFAQTDLDLVSVA